MELINDKFLSEVFLKKLENIPLKKKVLIKVKCTILLNHKTLKLYFETPSKDVYFVLLHASKFTSKFISSHGDFSFKDRRLQGKNLISTFSRSSFGLLTLENATIQTKRDKK